MTAAALINTIAEAALVGDLAACRALLVGSGEFRDPRFGDLSDVAIRFVVMGVIAGAGILGDGETT